MLLKTIPLEARIENQPYGIAGILYHGTEIYESWTTLLLNPTLLKDESLWSSHWCLIRTHHNYPYLLFDCELIGSPGCLYIVRISE